MSDSILSIEGVSKHYQLGVFGTGSLAGDLKRWWYKSRGLEDPFLSIGEENDRSVPSDSGLVWALQDINFSVERGEAIGIIGANGAGKSTLLKLLSRVTKPTRGEIKYNGRMASLLEVGTGFHPELTGRENIFLNGGILGMRRPEILKKLEEIVVFSGCGRYIDTPVKRYSSGMRVRLGFAVAAFLNPEILVVDEVLAVGDAEFQKKAIGKMRSVSKEERRTVLFVSHNMASIQNLCKRAILLDSGKIKEDGDVDTVIEKYLRGLNNNSADKKVNDIETRTGGNVFRFTDVKFYDQDLQTYLETLISGKNIKIELYYSNNKPFDEVYISLAFYTSSGNYICACPSQTINKSFNVIKGEGKISCIINRFPLSEGSYTYKIFASQRNITLDMVERAGDINVIGGDFYGSGKVPPLNRPSVLIGYKYE
jgi:lipopolysaccharide transport system ATP-binding protein